MTGKWEKLGNNFYEFSLWKYGCLLNMKMLRIFEHEI